MVFSCAARSNSSLISEYSRRLSFYLKCCRNMQIYFSFSSFLMVWNFYVLAGEAYLCQSCIRYIYFYLVHFITLYVVTAENWARKMTFALLFEIFGNDEDSAFQFFCRRDSGGSQKLRPARYDELRGDEYE